MTMGITITMMETELEIAIIIMPDVGATMTITHVEEQLIMLQVEENT